jgi:hypothetical protein
MGEMVSFNFVSPLCLRGESRLGGSQSKSGVSGEERISCRYQETNYDLSAFQFVVVAAYRLSYPGWTNTDTENTAFPIIMIFCFVQYQQACSPFITYQFIISWVDRENIFH